MCVCAQLLSHIWLCEPLDCSPPGSSVCRIFQARILQWLTISSSRGSSWPRDQTCIACVFCIGKRVLYYWVTWEAQAEAYFMSIPETTTDKEEEDSLKLIRPNLQPRVVKSVSPDFMDYLGRGTQLNQIWVLLDETQGNYMICSYVFS